MFGFLIVCLGFFVWGGEIKNHQKNHTVALTQRLPDPPPTADT